MRNIFLKLMFLTFVFTGVSLNTEFTTAYASSNDSQVTTEYTLYNNLTSTEQENLIKKVPTGTITHDKENFKLVFKKIDSVTNSVLPINNAELETPQQISKTSATTLPKTGATKNNTLISLLGFSTLPLALFLLIRKKKYFKFFLSLLLVLSGSSFFVIYDEVYADENTLPTIDSTVLTKGSNYNPNIELTGYKYIGYLHNYSDENKTSVEESRIIVKHQDTEGNKLSDDMTLTGAVGDPYIAEQKSFDGYTFKNVTGDISGKFKETSQTVTFIFEKEPVLGNITLKQTGVIDATNRGYIKPNFYKVTYYDQAGTILKTEKIDKDTTLSDETISINVGSEYTVYSKVTYECYSVETGERLDWGDYELVANIPELTSRILEEPNLTIEYTFNDLSWV